MKTVLQNTGEITPKKIIMLGAGNLATHLSRALKSAGHEIIQVYSRTKESAKHLAGILGAEWTTDPAGLLTGADITLFAIADNALPELVTRTGTIDNLVVHTSGSTDMHLLRKTAVRYGVFYPLQTFTRSRPVDFSRIPVCLEANSREDEKLLTALAGQLSARVVHLSSPERRHLHLAAVFACNFTNHMYSLASSVLEEQELPFDLLIPLITETAEKARWIHPREGQTGPAVRNDRNVIEKHLDLLSFSPETRELYEMLSRSIFRLYEGTPGLREPDSRDRPCR